MGVSPEGGSRVTHGGARVRGRLRGYEADSRFDQRRPAPARRHVVVDHLAETWGETGAREVAAQCATRIGALTAGVAGETALATDATGRPNAALAAANHSSSGI